MAAKAQRSTTESPRRRQRRPPKAASNLQQSSDQEVPMHFEDLPRNTRPPSTRTRKPRASDLSTMVITEGRPQSGTQARRTNQRQKSTAAAVTFEDDKTKTPLHHLTSVLETDRMEELFSMLKTYILAGLTGKRRLSLLGLDDEFQKVRQVVQQTIVAGEGNSMLVIGARGSGKTTLVDNVLSQLQWTDDRDCREDFYVVRLNGFVHTDDRLALKEIWRQLGSQMKVDDEAITAKSNYADILTSLLALLSHPAEHSSTTIDEMQTSKSVIFIIDEFDLFTSHPRQTLLYNLFDVAQSRKAPIAVLGLTTKVSVAESLEKRVKSRFSHRYVHLSLPKTFGAFQVICTSVLLCRTIHHNSSLTDPFKGLSHEQKPFLDELIEAWDNYITCVLTEDDAVVHLLRRIYAHTKSVSDFMSICLIPIISMTPKNIPSALNFASNSLFCPDSKLQILPGLSEIELALLIAAARLDIILDTDTCNFNMAYDEYLNLASRVKLLSSASGAAAVGGAAKIWGREIAMGAWERLEALELLVPALGAGGAVAMADIGRSGKLWKVDAGLEEIGASRLDMGAVMRRWCKEL